MDYASWRLPHPILSTVLSFTIITAKIFTCLLYLCRISGMLTQLAAATAANGTKRPTIGGKF